MAAPTVTEGEVVRELKQLLDDRYPYQEDPEVVLRELLQNADDACASRLDFVLVDEGLSAPDNPIFAGPGLLCFNDGPLSAADKQAIMAKSGTSKQEDSGAIGRFGLGLKSIFHLCEIFAFLGKDGDDSTLRGEIFDPWAPQNGDLNEVEALRNTFTDSDKTALIDCVDSVAADAGLDIDEGDGWFALWVPFRREGAEAIDHTPLFPRFPDLDDFWEKLDRPHSYVPLLAHLTTLESVHLWRADSLQELEVPSASAEWHIEEGERPHRHADQAGDSTNFNGTQEHLSTIQASGTVASESRAHGVWSLEEIESLHELRDNEYWPTTLRLNTDGNRWEKAPDKAEYQGAVTVITSPSAGDRPGTGDIQWSWAVFLPVGEPESLIDQVAAKSEHDDQQLQIDNNWTILLHGYFFPDSGRRGVVGINQKLGYEDKEKQPTSSKGVKNAWNRRLCNELLLPLLPQALEAPLEADGVDRQEARTVVRALAESDLFKKHRTTICDDYGLVETVSSEAPKPRWSLQPADVSLVPVPSSATDSRLRRSVLEALEELGAVPVSPDAPSLLPAQNTPRWDHDSINAVLGSLDGEALNHPADLRWFAELVDMMAGQNTGSRSVTAKRLAEFLARVLPTLEVDQMRRAASVDAWQALLERLPPVRLHFPGPYDRFGPALDALYQSGTVQPSFLPFPKELCSEKLEERLLEDLSVAVDVDAVKLCLLELGKTLEEDTLSQEILTSIRDLAGSFVSLVGATEVLEDAELASLPLFRVWSASEETYTSKTLEELDQVARETRAFLPGFNPHPRARKLRSALRREEADVLIVPKNGLDRLLDLPSTDLPGLARALLDSANTVVEDREPRLELLNELLAGNNIPSPDNFGQNSQAKRALRYLLHADSGKRNNRNAVLLNPREDIEVSDEALGHLLQGQGLGWTVLDSDMVMKIRRDWLKALNVRDLGRSALEEPASKLTASHTEKWPESVRREWLDYFRTEGNLWLEIPLHRTREGRLTSIDANCYLEGRRTIPAAIRDQVTLIEPVDSLSDKYRAQVGEFNATAQLNLGLDKVEKQGADAALCTVILDALNEIRVAALREPLRERLARTSWLVDSAGQPSSPRDLVAFPASVADLVQPLLQRLTAQVGFRTRSQFDNEISEHSAFDTLLSEFAATGTSALDALADDLEGTLDRAPATLRRRWIVAGERSRQSSSSELLRAGLQADLTDTHNGWSLLKATATWLAEEEGHNLQENLPASLADLFSALCTLLQASEVQHLLTSTSDRLRAEDIGTTPGYTLFRCHLEGALAHPDFREVILPELSLPTAANNWCSAHRIVLADARDTQVAADYRLHKDCFQFFDASAVEFPAPQLAKPASDDGTEVADPASYTDHALDDLTNYMAGFLDRVNRVQIGIFVSLFGDGPGGCIRELADNLLGNQYDVDVIRKELGKHAVVYDYNDMSARKIPRARCAIQLMGVEDEMVASSLTSRPIRVTPGQPNSLVAEKPTRLYKSKDSAHWVQLRDIDFDSRPNEVLSDLIRNAVEKMTRAWLRRGFSEQGFEKFWSKFEDSQADVSGVRAAIVEDLPALLRPLWDGRSNCREASELKKKLDAYKSEQKQLRPILQRLGDGESFDEDSDYLERIKARQEALRNITACIDADDDVADFVLERVQDKMQDYQYGPGDVLFELFQNADDALAELEQVTAPGELNGHNRTISVSVQRGTQREPDTILLRHSGRPINTPATGDSRFQDDLENMLMMNVSSKPGATDMSSEDQTTGHFGLGFKSVHLLTSDAAVSSGTIAFRVRAGLLPTPWHDVPQDGPWQKGDKDAVSPTLIRIPLDQNVATDKVLSRFRQLACFLPITSRSANGVVVDDPGKKTERFETQPFGFEGVETLKLAELSGIPDLGSSQIISVDVQMPEKSQTNALVAFAVKNGKVKPLPDGVPTVWNTAPTAEQWELGYLLNGPVAVDVGRSRINMEDSNTYHVLRALGRSLGQSLVDLFDATRDEWATVGPQLDAPSEDSTGRHFESFWRSVWAIFSRGFDAASAAPDKALKWLHANDKGISRLVTSRPAIPTRLAGDHRRLLQIDDVEVAVKEQDILASLEGIELVSEGSIFADILPPGRTVRGDVAKVLDATCGTRTRKMGLADVLEEWTLHQGGEDQRISVEPAANLAVIESLKENHGLGQAALRAIRNWKGNLKFQAADGSWRPARELAHPRAADELDAAAVGRAKERDRTRYAENCRIAALAPPDKRLADDYAIKPDALRFFLFVRENRQPGDVEDLVEWVRDADGDTDQDSALRYLVDGEHGETVAEMVLQHGPLDWIPSRQELHDWLTDSKRTNSPYWTDARSVRLQRRLFPDERPSLSDLILDEEGQPVEFETDFQTLSPLQDLHDWWSDPEIRDRYVEKWNQRWYPNAYSFYEVREHLKDGTLRERHQAYMVVMVLALGRGLGRTRAVQNAGFIDNLYRSGDWSNWWERLFHPDAEPREWHDVLEEWAKNRLSDNQYDYWMRLLPDLFQAWRWRDEYLHLFESLDRRGDLGDVSAKLLFAPGEDQAQQQGGVDAPAFPSLNGPAGVFAIREFTRLGLYEHPDRVAPLCYCHSSQLEYLLDERGCGFSEVTDRVDWSRRVHHFVKERLGSEERAGFHGDFDIPLHTILPNQNRALYKQLQAGTLPTADSDDDPPAETTLAADTEPEPAL